MYIPLSLTPVGSYKYPKIRTMVDNESIIVQFVENMGLTHSKAMEFWNVSNLYSTYSIVFLFVVGYVYLFYCASILLETAVWDAVWDYCSIEIIYRKIKMISQSLQATNRLKNRLHTKLYLYYYIQIQNISHIHSAYEIQLLLILEIVVDRISQQSPTNQTNYTIVSVNSNIPLNTNLMAITNLVLQTIIT